MPTEPSDFVFKSALEAARAIRRGEVSSLELTKQILERIEKYNPTLNAVVTILRDDALNRARAADEALSEKIIWGPLHGVPCSVKDTLEIANVLTTAGSPELATHVPKRDADVVERLRGAGAVIIGHTNVPLLAADWQSYNEIFGTTNNPWDHKRTPG
ncbi:MAG: glutamyl-tRNA amidotransferase, partial [Candidatus Lokiarchaeota archaeon]|nr:glutamyl-tRNA amidotransferase [Candidatus Lokiarchaeota archaeon]